MRISKDKIEELAGPIVEAMGYYIWHIELNRAKRRSLLRIYIDRMPDSEAKGVDIDDCGKISNQIGAVLEVEDPFSGSYVLEVSSPGVERSLYKLEHYQKYIGSEIKVSLFRPIDGKKSLIGTLQSINNRKVNLLIDDKYIEFELADVAKARLIVSF